MLIPDSFLKDAENVIDQLFESIRGTKELISRDNALLSVNLGRDNIVGFGVGEKVVGGRPQNWPAIQMFVVRKAPPEEVYSDYLADHLISCFVVSGGDGRVS